MTIIKRGFRLTVTSWENDGDYCNTKSKEGISHSEVAFDLDVVRIYAKHFGNECYSWGGDDDSDPKREACIAELKAAFDKHAKFVADNFGDEDGKQYSALSGEDDDYIEIASEIAYEYMGSSECYMCRVLDSFTVEFIPADVVLEDVTREFE